MNFRQVHLDFHTSEKIEQIGKLFDKKQFQNALKQGHVDSVTLFSKCHHGWSYHPSKTNQMHPQLDFDLFGEQIKAAQELGVNVVGYISAGLDEKYAVEHPQCLARNSDESIHRTGDFTVAGYHLLCFNSPYLQILADQVREMCECYDVKGVFLDIVNPIPCYCRNCARLMEEEGLDITQKADVNQMAEKTYIRYTRAMRDAVDSVKPGLPIFHNGGRTPRGRRDLLRMNSHVEIESLPTGGWGYDDLPLTSRYVQPLGMEFLGMTGKFHRSWGEFGGYKHENALIYETALAVANGGKCSIGDQLHPLGKMDDETYRLIGAAYARIEERESWLSNVNSVADIAILSYDSWQVKHPEIEVNPKLRNCDIGALRILLEGHYLFDVIDTESDFTRYKVLLLPDHILVDDDLKQKLDQFVAGGGKLLASARSALPIQETTEGLDFLYDLGASYIGSKDISPSYIVPSREIENIHAAGYVIYASAECASLRANGTVLAEIHDPYFNRTATHFCSHLHAPEKLEFAGIGMSEGAHGIYFASAIFREYAEIGSLIVKQLVCTALDRLLEESKTVTVELPAQGNVTMMNQYEENRAILHLLYAPRIVKGATKIEVIEDSVPLYHVPVTLKASNRIPKRVYLAPEKEEISFRIDDRGRVCFEVPEIRMHTMVVIDYAEPMKGDCV